MTRRASPRLEGYAVVVGDRPRRRARATAAGARDRRRAVRAPARARDSGRPASPSSRSRSRSRPSAIVEGEPSRRDDRDAGGDPGRPARAPARASRGSRGRRAAQTRSRSGSARARSGTIQVALRCTGGESTSVGDSRCAHATCSGSSSGSGASTTRSRLKAYPRPRIFTGSCRRVETQAYTGSEVARAKGEGIEYADIREYVPGDRLRAINWRASARRGGLVVNERHPERNTDVVLFVDSFVDVRGRGRSTLDDAVRAGCVARGPVSRAARSRGPRHVRWRPPLAPARHGPDRSGTDSWRRCSRPGSSRPTRGAT